MPTVSTYQIYISGTPANPIFGGDINTSNQLITPAVGAVVMVIDFVDLFSDTGGAPVVFDSTSPITFPAAAGQPSFVSWALMSPTQLLLTDVNFNIETVGFLLNPAGGPGISPFAIDPTIVNTYTPPEPLLPPSCLDSERRIA